jgi:hypothetical protein
LAHLEFTPVRPRFILLPHFEKGLLKLAKAVFNKLNPMASKSLKLSGQNIGF